MSSKKMKMYEKAYKKCIKSCKMNKKCRSKCKSPLLNMNLVLKSKSKRKSKKRSLNSYQKFVKIEYPKHKHLERSEIFSAIAKKWKSLH